MDKGAERSGKDKILRRLRGALAPLGFERTKPTFFTRPSGLVVEFIHLHKFTFAPEFRVHLGLRVTNDGFPAAALNGPDSLPYVCKEPLGGRRYNFRYHLEPETIERCASEVTAYVQTIAEPWFHAWRPVERLLSAASPLTPEARDALRAAVEAGAAAERVALTRGLLGVA
jgi:hypothetical protein